MNRITKFIAVVVLIHPWFSRVEGQEDRLGLADLAGYRAALSGKATADDAGAADPPAQVRFSRPLGAARRISRPACGRGRAGRTDLPPRAGRQLPRAGRGLDHRDVRRPILPGLSPSWAHSIPVPEPGREVRFTGTFLKMVRYAAQ